MLLYLLRHGETDWNAERRIQGVSDIPLNEVGLSQAEAFVQLLAGRTVHAIYASPFRRSRQTAEMLASALGLPILDESRLAELDQGELEGKTMEELEEQHNGFLVSWRTRPAKLRMPGGETLVELQERAWAALEDFRVKHLGETVAAVSHNLTITALLCRILGMDLDRFRVLRQHNAALNIIEYDPERGWSVVTMNSLSHLRDTSAAERNPYV